MEDDYSYPLDEDEIEELDKGDIEACSKLYTESIDINRRGVDLVRYLHVFEGDLRRENEIKNKRVVKYARYDTENDQIEWQTDYYLNGELIEESDWTERAEVNPESWDSEGVIVNPFGTHNHIEADNLKRAIEDYIHWEFFTDPTLELGEQYYKATGEV